MDRLLSGDFTHPGNLRLAKHLRRHQKSLFVFLDREDVEASRGGKQIQLGEISVTPISVFIGSK
jgi:hypothetical protein